MPAIFFLYNKLTFPPLYCSWLSSFLVKCFPVLSMSNNKIIFFLVKEWLSTKSVTPLKWLNTLRLPLNPALVSALTSLLPSTTITEPFSDSLFNMKMKSCNLLSFSWSIVLKINWTYVTPVTPTFIFCCNPYLVVNWKSPILVSSRRVNFAFVAITINFLALLLAEKQSYNYRQIVTCIHQCYSVRSC